MPLTNPVEPRRLTLEEEENTEAYTESIVNCLRWTILRK